MIDRAFVLLQYLLPKHLMTALVWRATRIRHTGFKNYLISRFVALYNVEVDEIRLDVPNGFETFNDFFTRDLDANARTTDAAADTIVSPADGTVSIASTLVHNSIIQAKGIGYTLDDLLCVDLGDASAYRDGSIATIYLAPHNYHRVHAPIGGKLVSAHYVPGDLFSVNEATVARVKGLFRRNERLILHFETTTGPVAVIFVGAMMVGSITTPWTGEIRPRKRGVVEALDISGRPGEVGKGDLLGWFNMGSTVILLLPKGRSEWNEDLAPGRALRVGEAIGRRTKQTT